MAQGLIIFILLTTVISGIIGAMENNYGVTDEYTQSYNGKNSTITRHFSDLTNSINGDLTKISSAMNRIVTPQNAFDILGGLATAGIGIVTLIWDMVSIPARILDIIFIFYDFPPVLINFVTLTFLVAFAFIMIRVYVKEDV